MVHVGPVSQGKLFSLCVQAVRHAMDLNYQLPRLFHWTIFGSSLKNLWMVFGASFSYISTLYMSGYAQEPLVRNLTIKQYPKASLQNTRTHQFNFNKFLYVLDINSSRLLKLTSKTIINHYTPVRFKLHQVHFLMLHSPPLGQRSSLNDTCYTLGTIKSQGTQEYQHITIPYNIKYTFIQENINST